MPFSLSLSWRVSLRRNGNIFTLSALACLKPALNFGWGLVRKLEVRVAEAWGLVTMLVSIVIVFVYGEAN